jgi:hypothetical protein
MPKTALGLKGRVLKMKFALLIESWIFTFFPIFVFSYGFTRYHLQCDRYNLNAFLNIFSRSFTSSIELEFLVKTPVNKRIIVHSYLQI